MSTPCLVLSFEHDVDSPPAAGAPGRGAIPGARFVELAGASHLGVFTHADAGGGRHRWASSSGTAGGGPGA